MSNVLRIGLWGCGGMGRSLAQALVATEQAQLVAAYDLRPEAVSAIASDHGGETVASVEALLAYPALDGLIIALPPYLHAPAVEQAAQAGIGLFLEKPMSVDVTGCRRILNAVHQHGVPLMVGQVLRYYEPYRSIQRWRAEGRFGLLYAASIWRVSDGHRIDPAHWRASNARSGGYLLEVGAHELDMLRCLMGRPQTVCALSRKVSTQGGEWADYIALQIQFAAGGAATYEAGAGSYVGRYGFRLYFEQAAILSDAAFDRAALQVYDADGQKIDLSAEFSPEHPVQAELRGWLAALRGEAQIAIPGEEGMATVALAEAGYRSAQTGSIVAYGAVLGD
jgi:predicted dehydrogenase